MSGFISVAFVGAGNMTAQHLRAFADIKNVRLTGICSRSIEKAKALAEKYPGLQCCDSITDLYQKTKADIVVVSVSELSALAVAQQCFEYPWVCAFEKPLGLNLQEANKIADTADRLNRKTFVLFNRRQYSSTRTILADLQQQAGDRYIHVQDQEDLLVEIQKNNHPELIRYWMYANSVHLVDYFILLGRGAVTDVKVVRKWEPSQPHEVIAEIEFESGDTGLYQAIWNQPAPWLVSVNTPARRWELRPIEKSWSQDYGSRKQAEHPVHAWDTDFKPGLRLQAEELIKAFSGEAHQLADVKESLKTMQLIHRIYGI
jgi:predicted dehydrogenase